MKVKIKLNSNESIFKTPEMLLEAMAKFRYIDFTNLMSPLEVFLTLQGSCHDQVMFEYSELEEMGLKPHAKFLMIVDDNNRGLETHSFVYYIQDDKYCWFENAWEAQRGIHKFDSYDAMISYITEQYRPHVSNNKLYLADFIPAEHTIGESLGILVDTCMNTAQPLI